jgi:hypothetical protein
MSKTPRTDAFEALVERPINWWDFARELERENAALREKDEDWENAVLHARDHRCDEAHCTCVVPLLGKINQLERENSVLRSALDQQANYQRELRADRDRLDWLGENTEITIRKVVSGLFIFEHNEIIWPEDKGKLREKIDAARKEAQP